MASENQTAICLLVINKVKTMPEMAIRSILRTTPNDIYIGYLKSEDIEDIPIDNRVKFIKLAEVDGWSSDQRSDLNYVDFSKSEFYKLVQYKWVLLQHMCNLGFESVIFSDFDLIWNLDPIPSVNDTFKNFPELDIQIQTYTSSPSQERLCMGFVALRNSAKVIRDIETLRELHAQFLRINPFSGDDDVISSHYNRELDFRSRVRLLPQSTFPTGNLINVFSNRSLFPGLTPYVPYIFHANFVVGSRKKILLMRTFLLNSRFEKSQLTFFQKRMTCLILFFRRLGVLLKKSIN